ncbi:phospholipase ABHD3 isoform X2 [Latimeria chalumnae]|uniref:phospholipase ABHD3 isoform X2 n=1 Tax=Latimeria chalumnae TaxID=7897 RepID=UPI00313B032B
MKALELDLNGLTRELSLYLENQVKVGFFGSGVGLFLFLGFSAAYACYYLSSVAKKPQLVSGGEKFGDFLRAHCPVVTETYFPPFWCWEGRIQTLLRPFITAKPWVDYRNELIKTADGGQISLDWFDNDDNALYPDSNTRPTILILPGLTGTSKESYILHMIRQSESMGYRMLLLNYLARTGKDTPLRAAAVFSAGWDVFECSASLEKPLNWLLFNYYLTTCLQASVNRHRQVLEKLFDIDYVMKAKTLKEFDERFTSAMFGYPTIDDYYTDASPCHKLKSVAVPVLCLNSMDDVFSPGHAIPVEAAKQSPNVAFVLTSCGGHIGFLEGMWPRQCTYMDRVFKQFVQAIFEHGNGLLDYVSPYI